MSASALRPKTNMRRLTYFLVISLVVHIILLFGTSIDYMFGKKPVAAAAHGDTSAPEATPNSAATPAPEKGAEVVTLTTSTADKPADKKAIKDGALPPVPAKPKDADAEFNKRQKPATEQEKRQAESIRPDLDSLK